MAIDESMVERVRSILAPLSNITEKKMFGGIAFMLSGNMCCGVKESLMVRVGPQKYEAALAMEHVQQIDTTTGKPMRGMVHIATHALQDERQLQQLLAMGTAFAESLPPK